MPKRTYQPKKTPPPTRARLHVSFQHTRGQGGLETPAVQGAASVGGLTRGLPQMQRKHRLTSGKRYSQIHSESKGRANRFLVIKSLPNDLNETRFGILVGKRIGNAVARNRTKRRIRESLRQTSVETWLGRGYHRQARRRKSRLPTAEDRDRRLAQ